MNTLRAIVAVTSPVFAWVAGGDEPPPPELGVGEVATLVANWMLSTE